MDPELFIAYRCTQEQQWEMPPFKVFAFLTIIAQLKPYESEEHWQNISTAHILLLLHLITNNVEIQEVVIENYVNKEGNLFVMSVQNTVFDVNIFALLPVQSQMGMLCQVTSG